MKRLDEQDDILLGLAKQYRDALARVEDLDARLKKLQGRFYAAKYEAPEAAPAASREERKAQALAKAGIKPGKPVDLRTIKPEGST
jgi:hypothetical protein